MKISVRNLFLIMLFSGIFLLSTRPINDPDFWWHLRTGQLMEETQTIPRTDPFSWSAQGNPWVTHEWLSEQIIYQLYSVGSFQLLVITFSLIITVAYFFGYKRCPSDSMPYVAGFSLLLGALASRSLWGVRPQMITLLFTSVFLFLLDSYLKTGNGKKLIPIPIIMIIAISIM